MLDQSQYNQLANRTVIDNNGDKIGDVGQIFTDESGQPEWVTVHTGLFGMKESFVPIHEAELRGDGALFVPITKDEVNEAPQIDTQSESQLSLDEERRLYQHYNLPYSDWQSQGDVLTEDPQGTSQVRLRRFTFQSDPGSGTVRTETHTQEQKRQRGTN